MKALIAATALTAALLGALPASAETAVEDAAAAREAGPRVITNHWEKRRDIDHQKAPGQLATDLLISPFAAIAGTVEAISLSPRLN
ncbi:MAG: hypothetical protein AAF415_17355 [Pseudomonadota bacterium]